MAKTVKKKESYLVLNSIWQEIVCYRCGVHEDFKKLLPCSTGVFAAWGGAWAKDHRHCKETDRGRDLRAKAERDYWDYLDRHPEEDPRHGPRRPQLPDGVPAVP